ncbi:MAG: MFS transporter, partial [Clostridia bacterium]|nr:MFS transporter [Clostridia bacterium]
MTQLGFGIVTPALPVYAASFGVGTAAVGLVISSYGLARLVADLPVGTLAERVGRRPLLIGGGIILGVGSALCAVAPSFPALVAFRFLAGAGAATVLTAAQIILADLSSTDNRGRVMAIYQGFFLVGVGLGPAPGGFLADRFGPAAPFLAYGALATTAAGISALWVPETRAPGRRPPHGAQAGHAGAQAGHVGGAGSLA